MHAQYTRLMLILAGIFAAIGLVWLLNYQETSDNQSTKALQETLQTSVSANRDDSSRVVRGVYVLDRKPFESSFESALATSRGLGFKDLKKGSIKYTYLLDKSAADLMNNKLVDKNGNKLGNDYAKASSPYIAVKGVRVLIDNNNNGTFTDKDDYVATIYVDSRSGDGFVKNN